jgi:glycosyltransferase involved in cell wall biosynthesis
MDRPKISIVIAAYNAVGTLGKTIESLLAQTYNDYEIIVIDGASQDGTIELIKSYDRLITVWSSEPDQGIYDAWNKGVRLARGDWIGFIGADDTYVSDALEEYQKYFTAHPNLDYISSKVKLFNDLNDVRVIGRPWVWNNFRRYMCTAHVGSLHNRNLFLTYGNFNKKYKICGDYEFLLRAGKNLKTGYIDKVLANMFYGGISNLNPKAFDETLWAKINNKSVNKYLAFFDYFVGITKWYIKPIYRRI